MPVSPARATARSANTITPPDRRHAVRRAGRRTGQVPPAPLTKAGASDDPHSSRGAGRARPCHPRAGRGAGHAGDGPDRAGTADATDGDGSDDAGGGAGQGRAHPALRPGRRSRAEGGAGKRHGGPAPAGPVAPGPDARDHGQARHEGRGLRDLPAGQGRHAPGAGRRRRRGETRRDGGGDHRPDGARDELPTERSGPAGRCPSGAGACRRATRRGLRNRSGLAVGRHRPRFSSSRVPRRRRATARRCRPRRPAPRLPS